jgi:hypothetical protein
MLKGVPCAGGSDAPVEDCAPLQGMYDAVHRLPHALKHQTHPQGEESSSSRTTAERQAFLPDERLSFAEALWLYTGGAAYACNAETRLGRIEPGYAADFVVLDRDVTAGPGVGALLEARVEEVWVAGRRRFCLEEGQQRSAGAVATGSAKLDGPFIPGKNGQCGWPRPAAERQGALLPGKRLGLGCCGH